MRLSILQKFIGAFLGLTLLVLIATLGLARWSFERGFLDYVNTQEQLRLESAQTALAREYQRSGDSWDGLTQGRFAELMHTARPAARPPNPEQHGRRPPRFRDGTPMPPPPARAGRMRGDRPPQPPTAIYDVSGRLLAGEHLGGADTNLNRTSIIANGEKVGELRSALRHQLTSPQEAAFSAQQLNASWMIGGVAMALALIVSIVLARGMLAPVRRMLGDVSRLSNGDYSIRIGSDRSDELGDLMRHLDRLAITLDETRDSRRRWFADVSHELRTPVTVLRGELEAMQDGVRQFDRTQLDSLMQEVQRLRYLIDDLYELSMSDIGALRYEYSMIALDESLASAVEGIRMRAAESGVDIELAIVPVKISGDLNRLDQLFTNLFTNSLDYTDSPGKIRVSLEQSGDQAVVNIEDSPPGVSASECEQLFEPLYRRESSRSRRTGGAGLGLAICRKVVAAHGGSIFAMPSSLGGLCIQIKLPVTREGESK